MNERPDSALSTLPSINKITEAGVFGQLATEFGMGLTKFELRSLIEALRTEILDGKRPASPPIDELLVELRTWLLRAARPEGRRAINASGILLHTGLGRSPLCSEAILSLAGFDHYSVLQTDIAEGGRNQRDERVARMLRELTGGETATIANNNAGATVLILNTLAQDREVIISRGQLIEIGGSFRIPDVMRKSGAILHEVGTTNRTHLRDYEEAINENTAAIMHVHTSNYRVRGFSGTPPIQELVVLGKRRALPVIDDLGSGALVPLHEFGLSDEPLVRDSIAAGSDVVCFSGDKLISGPQSGIIVGRNEIISRIRKNPFARMFRVGKLTLAALEATLIHFINGDSYRQAIPLYRMLSRSMEDIDSQAHELVRLLGEPAGVTVSIADNLAYVGSGSLPDEGMPTKVVRIMHERTPPERLAKRLRMGIPAVFGRVKDELVLLDMRTVQPDEVQLLASLIGKVLAELKD